MEDTIHGIYGMVLRFCVVEDRLFVYFRSTNPVAPVTIDRVELGGATMLESGNDDLGWYARTQLSPLGMEWGDIFAAEYVDSETQTSTCLVRRDDNKE